MPTAVPAAAAVVAYNSPLRTVFGGRNLDICRTRVRTSLQGDNV